MTPLRTTPLETPATWHGAALQAHPEEWRYELCAREVADLERAAERARATGKRLSELGREDFPLPVLGPVVERWLATLQRGRGFLNVKSTLR